MEYLTVLAGFLLMISFFSIFYWFFIDSLIIISTFGFLWILSILRIWLVTINMNITNFQKDIIKELTK